MQSSEQTILNDTQDQGTANDDEHYYHTLDPTQSETREQVNVDLSCTVESARLSPIRDTKTVKSNQLYSSPDQAASPQKEAVMYVTNVTECQTQQSHVNMTLSDSTQTLDKLGTAHDAPVLSNIVYCQFDDLVYDSGPSHQNNVEAKTIKVHSSVSLQEKASDMDKNNVVMQKQDCHNGAPEYSDPMDLGSVDDNMATLLGNREIKDQEMGIHEIFDDPKYSIGLKYQ